MEAKYYLNARLFPSVLTAIPMMVFYYNVLHPIVNEYLAQVWEYLPLITGVSLNAAFIFLLVMVNRYISKVTVQRWYYQDEIKMPTTDWLMSNSTLTDKLTRNRLYKLIECDFHVDLPGDMKSLSKEEERRKHIVQVVGLIRNKLRGNAMLLQHNIEYGFTRNFLGGAFLAEVFSIAVIVYAIISQQTGLIWTGGILFLLYLLPLLFSKRLVENYGRNYASVLFSQYESLER